MTIAKTFAQEHDVYAILATYAYVFCGLKISDIKEMIILSDRSGVRCASREYVRQKIVTTFHKIQRNYIEEYGDSNVSPTHRTGNLDPIQIEGLSARYKELIMEERQDGNESHEEEEKAAYGKKAGKGKTKKAKGTTNKRKASSNRPKR